METQLFLELFQVRDLDVTFLESPLDDAVIHSDFLPYRKKQWQLVAYATGRFWSLAAAKPAWMELATRPDRLPRVSLRNYFDIDYSKYNKNKYRNK
jgi:hypothetical protein